MPDTRLLQGKNDEGGTLAAILTVGALSATLNIAPSKAPGVLVLEAGTIREERIYYATKDDTAKTVSGLIRDYSNVNGGVGFEHQASTPWETMQDIEYINNIVDALREGFISEYNVATYVSASSFTVVGDQTSIYTAGRQTRYNQDNTKIGIVASSSYNSGTGLTTVLTNYGTVPNPITILEYGIQPKTATTLVATGSGAQNLAYNYAADTGAANAYAVALTPVPTAYAAGMLVVFKAGASNTTASTLAVNGMAAKNILRRSGSALAPKDILANQIVCVIYDGTQFLLLWGFDQATGDYVIAGSGTGKVKANALFGDLIIDADGATITIDCTSVTGANRHQVILGGNRILALSNPASGQIIVLDLIQDGTGSRLISEWPHFDAVATMTIAAPGVVTSNRDIPTGTPVTFSTTGALPTGLVAGTVYYWTRINATTGNLSTSLANCQAGTFITTSGSQSGTHTLKVQIRWTGNAAPTLSTGKFLIDTIQLYIKDITNGLIQGYIGGQGL